MYSMSIVQIHLMSYHNLNFIYWIRQTVIFIKKKFQNRYVCFTQPKNLPYEDYSLNSEQIWKKMWKEIHFYLSHAF